MRLAQRRGNDEPGELAAEHVLLRVSERVLGRAVELENMAAVVDRDHGVERRVEDRGCVRLDRRAATSRAAQARCRDH